MRKLTTPMSGARTVGILRRASPTAAIAGAALSGMLAVAAPGAAQTVCGERAEIIAELARVNAETPAAIGLSTSGTLIELLVSPSGDWSIVVTYPTEDACLVAIGEHWQTIPVAAAAAPDA